MLISSEKQAILSIVDVSRGGAGLAKRETGQVVFVPYTAPGDEVLVEILSQKKHYAQAQLLKILKPSPIRQTPRCPAFGICGGCDWQHLPYSFQWEIKKRGVSHALQRMGNKLLLEAWPRVQEFPAQKIWNYRNRIQLRGQTNSKGGLLGFYKAHSLDLVPLKQCDLADERLNDIWQDTQHQGNQLRRPYKVELEIREGVVSRAWNQAHSHSGFRQVHDDQNKVLQQWVQSQLTLRGPLYDLFGGQGNLSLPLLDSMGPIHCVDMFPSLPTAPVPHFFFHRGLVDEWLDHCSPNPIPSSAILDPPRLGLGKSLSRMLKNFQKLNIVECVLIGCDPDAWAKDLKGFLEWGWNIEQLMVLDFFPQTHHVECGAKLSRSKVDSCGVPS